MTECPEMIRCRMFRHGNGSCRYWINDECAKGKKIIKWCPQCNSSMKRVGKNFYECCGPGKHRFRIYRVKD